MGGDGLTRATQIAVLSANYVAARLRDRYPVLYTGRGGLVAHECIVDLREITKDTGVTVDDVAKRLIDYGFHAPTMSFPVAGTLMIEPTESEDLGELDRFCDAMLAIRAEIDEVAAGTWAVEDSPLRGAPHTRVGLLGDWNRAVLARDRCLPASRRCAGRSTGRRSAASTARTATATSSAHARAPRRSRTEGERSVLTGDQGQGCDGVVGPDLA